MRRLAAAWGACVAAALALPVVVTAAEARACARTATIARDACPRCGEGAGSTVDAIRVSTTPSSIAPAVSPAPVSAWSSTRWTRARLLWRSASDLAGAMRAEDPAGRSRV